MRSAACLLLLASCGLLPDRMEVSPSYGTGTLQRVGSPFSADAESYGIMLTFGWDLSAERQAAYANLARLDVDRAGRVQVHDHETHTGSAPEINFDIGGDEPEEKGGDSIISVATERPETLEDALVYLMWVVGFLGLLWGLKRSGLLGALKDRIDHPPKQENTKP